MRDNSTQQVVQLGDVQGEAEPIDRREWINDGALVDRQGIERLSRAFGTILDSHVTTLVAGVLLYWLGSGPVKGFAVTLSIGVLTSLFSAILVTRLLIVTWLRQLKPKEIPL